MGANGLECLTETGQALAFFFGGEGGPVAVIHMVEQVLHKPPFLGEQGGGRRFGGGRKGGRGHDRGGGGVG